MSESQPPYRPPQPSGPIAPEFTEEELDDAVAMMNAQLETMRTLVGEFEELMRLNAPRAVAQVPVTDGLVLRWAPEEDPDGSVGEEWRLWLIRSVARGQIADGWPADAAPANELGRVLTVAPALLRGVRGGAVAFVRETDPIIDAARTALAELQAGAAEVDEDDDPELH